MGLCISRAAFEIPDFATLAKCRSELKGEQVQADGRIRRWALVPEAGNRYLRVILLADGETVHNAFFDRSYTR